MDRAPWPDDAELMNPERADGDNQHQRGPNPSDSSMRNGALGSGQLNQSQDKGCAAAKACNWMAGWRSKRGASDIR